MRLVPAARSPHGKLPPGPRHRHRHRRVRAALTLAALASAFLVGACGSGSTSSSPPTTIGADATGAGPVTRSGAGSGSQSGNTTTGDYSVAFAKCMRAHGMPNFPNPNRVGNELGPGSEVSPTSAAFQAAVNGPCQSLAPAGWSSSGSGPVMKGAGS